MHITKERRSECSAGKTDGNRQVATLTAVTSLVLLQYLDGAKLLSRLTQSLDNEEKSLVQWVKNVDLRAWAKTPKQYGPSLAKDAKACFISRQTGAMAAFVVMLENWCDAAARLDPMMCEPQMQAPLYVGCSINFKARIASYSQLTEINKPLGLTMAVLDVCNIDVHMQHSIALRVWEERQLPIAEQLVTALADSFVHQTSFNIAEPGDNTKLKSTKSTDWDMTRRAVLGARTHVGSNLDALVADIGDRRTFVTKAAELKETVAQAEERLTASRILFNEAGSLLTTPGAQRLDTVKGVNQSLTSRYLKAWTILASMAFLDPESYKAAVEDLGTRD